MGTYGPQKKKKKVEDVYMIMKWYVSDEKLFLSLHVNVNQNKQTKNSSLPSF